MSFTFPKALARYRDQPVWVNWKRVRRKNGTFTKPPYQPRNPRWLAKPNDPATWGTFDQAFAALERGKADGVGICILGAEGLVGFDLDDAIHDDGSVEPFALELIKRANNSYTELSPSGRGFHIFGLSDGGELNRKQPVPGANGMSVETARRVGKYFTITGNRWGSAAEDLQTTAFADELIAELDSPQPKPELRPKPKETKASKRRRLNLDNIILNGGGELFGLKADGTPDRSKAVWWVIHELMRRGKDNDEIVSILLNRDNAISEHVYDQAQDAKIYARRQVENARGQRSSKGRGGAGGGATGGGGGGSGNLDPSDAQLLDELNRSNAVVLDGAKILVLRFDRREHNAGGEQYVYYEPVYLKFSDFRGYYCNRFVMVGDKSVGLGTWWLRHPDRRQYAGVVYQPLGPAVAKGNKFNLWRGWAVEPKQGDWSLMQRHIKVVLAAGDQAVADYILKWAAWAVQHPGEQAEVALVFVGERGTGKGTFGKALLRIFGSQHSWHISSPEHLTGRFNAHLRHCSFLFADEAYGPKDKAAEGMLKFYITESELPIEAKGLMPIKAPNCLHIMLASNNEWVVPAGMHERRFVVTKVSDAQMQKPEWFKPLYQQMENGGYAAMLYDLLNMDLGDWHPRQIVRTKALAEQQERSLSALDEWWFDVLQTGVLVGAASDNPSKPVSNRWEETIEEGIERYSIRRTVRRDGLYDHARASSPRLRAASDAALGRFLRNEQGGKPARPQRRRGWQMPPLSICRARWLERFPDTVWHLPELGHWVAEGNI